MDVNRRRPNLLPRLLQRHVRLQRVQLSQQFLLVNVVGNVVVASQRLVYLVAVIHQVSHLVVQSVYGIDVELLGLESRLELLGPGTGKQKQQRNIYEGF